MNKAKVVKELKIICLEYSDILGRVILFGSFSRDEATDQSDIDLYIEPRDINMTTARLGTNKRYREFKRSLYNRFDNEFDLMTYGGKRDLSAIKKTPLWDQIAKDGVIIYDQRTKTI